MTDYSLPESPVTGRTTLLARFCEPTRSTSIRGVTAGVWILAGALGIAATIEFGRLFATIVVSLILGH